MNRFKERVAIVTGGSRGIGKGISEAFLKEGANIAILDVDEKNLAATSKEFEEKGYSFLTKQADVSSRTEVEEVVKATIDRFGKVDILINNAGVIRDNLLFKMTDDDWDTVMDIHLKGAFYMSRAVQQVMVENKYGRIINISSTSALGNRGQANYAAAKAGLQGFTKTLAIELGKFNITTNAIAPGFIETDMTRATAVRMGVSFEEYSQNLINITPVRRSGKPEDIANAAMFFADESSSFVNGQVIYVAGGPMV